MHYVLQSVDPTADVVQSVADIRATCIGQFGELGAALFTTGLDRNRDLPGNHSDGALRYFYLDVVGLKHLVSANRRTFDDARHWFQYRLLENLGYVLPVQF